MGVDRPLVLLVDLSEPIGELRHQLQQLALSCLKNGVTQGYDYGTFLYYDVVPVMSMVLEELANPCPSASDVDQVKLRLISQGVPVPMAAALSADLTQMTLDIIGGQFPNFTFSDLTRLCTFQLNETGSILYVIFPSGMEFDRKNVPSI